MTLSDLSVRRPVFAAVAAIILVVVGIAAFTRLSVRELPSVDPPQVSISTSYVGASAEVVEERITEVIERQVSGIQGIDQITSSSRDGSSNINILFLPDRPLEAAANDVRDAVGRVQRQLPQDVDAPIVQKANADSTPIVVLALKSTTMNRLQLTDYANRYLVERLSTIDGVSQIQVGGAQNYAMRIWLDPDAMAARGVTVDDVNNALAQQNIELPAGSLESVSKDFTVRVSRQYARPEDFAQLPITTPTSVSGAGAVSNTGGAGAAQGPANVVSNGGQYITRLGDVARVEEGPDERRRMFRGASSAKADANGVMPDPVFTDMIGFQIIRQSDANDLDISIATRKAVDEINKTLPKGTVMSMAVDNSVFTSESIKEVWITMAISLALVALVNIVFLGSWRTAIIPTIVAPICILSTFTVLAVFGFSINLLTLLALVLAIGLVVDDAIVVVENIQRRIDEGEPPLVAAQRGAKQVFFAILAITMVLMAVFAPMMVLPGYTGKLFVELAVAVAAAIGFSALLALSLSPMLASKLLRPASGQGFFARLVDRSINALRNSYVNSLKGMIGRRTAAGGVVLVVLCMAGIAAGLFLILPKELVPNEDRGIIQVNAQGPVGAGYDYMSTVAEQMQAKLLPLIKEGIADKVTVTAPGNGGGQYNSASANVVLVPWSQRKVTSDDIATRISRESASITGARISASVRAPLARGGGGGGSNSFTMVAEGDDYDNINTWIQPILVAARGNPGFQRVRLDYEPTSPRLLINMDREKAASLGVPPRAIGSVLSTMLGSTKGTTYIKNGQEYDVILQTDLANRRTQDALNTMYVRSSQGALVPLSALVTTEVRGDTATRSRIDRQRAISLSADLAPGYTQQQAIDFVKALADKQPPGAAISWGGATRDYLQGQSGVGLAFAMALLLVFLVLAAQFESWIHPLVIISTVPLAALGGLFALFMTGASLNLYSQIGLIILIGIAAKNGILIVEFANQRRDEGLSIQEAILDSCSVRMRPIIMTSIAAAFGAIPLVFAHGPGAASRFTIGVVIFGGCLFATLLTLFVVPVFYSMVARFTKSPEWTGRQIDAYGDEDLIEHHPAPLAAE